MQQINIKYNFHMNFLVNKTTSTIVCRLWYSYFLSPCVLFFTNLWLLYGATLPWSLYTVLNRECHFYTVPTVPYISATVQYFSQRLFIVNATSNLQFIRLGVKPIAIACIFISILSFCCCNKYISNVLIHYSTCDFTISGDFFCL